MDVIKYAGININFLPPLIHVSKRGHCFSFNTGYVFTYPAVKYVNSYYWNNFILLLLT